MNAILISGGSLKWSKVHSVPNITIHRTFGKLRLPASGDF
jgi:hypothetical protein